MPPFYCRTISLSFRGSDALAASCQVHIQGTAYRVYKGQKVYTTLLEDYIWKDGEGLLLSELIIHEYMLKFATVGRISSDLSPDLLHYYRQSIRMVDPRWILVVGKPLLSPFLVFAGQCWQSGQSRLPVSHTVVSHHNSAIWLFLWAESAMQSLCRASDVMHRV